MPMTNNKLVQKRASEYAPPKTNFTRTADLWNAYLKGINNRPLEPRDVAAFNILQKISRLMHKYKEDSVEDIIGYAETWRIVEDDHA